MSIVWIIVLILGIVAIVTGILKLEYRNSTYWYLMAFWVALVFAAMGGGLHV